MGDVTRPLSRDEQIEKLRLVLAGGPGISVPETIFLHGLGATGRTVFIDKNIFLTNLGSHILSRRLPALRFKLRFWLFFP